MNYYLDLGIYEIRYQLVKKFEKKEGSGWFKNKVRNSSTSPMNKDGGSKINSKGFGEKKN